MKKKHNSISNKERDTAIAHLYQIVEQHGQTHAKIIGAVDNMQRMFLWYMEFRRTMKRFKKHFDKRYKLEQEKANEIQQNDKDNAKNMETSTADQG